MFIQKKCVCVFVISGLSTWVTQAMASQELTYSEAVYKALSSGVKGVISDFRHDTYSTNNEGKSSVHHHGYHNQAGHTTIYQTTPAQSSLSSYHSSTTSETLLYSDGGFGRKEQSRLGAYVRIDQETIPSQSHANRSHYEDGYTVTLGGDYLLNDHYLFGVALGLPYQQNGITEQSDLEVDGLMASGYFSYFQDDWYIDFSASYAVMDTDIERRVSTFDSSPFARQEKADSDIWVFSLGAGYLISHEHWDIALESSLQHILSDTDRYTERPSRGNANYLLSVVDDINQLGSSMLISGASFTYPFRTSIGLFQPYMRGYVHYDFDNGGQKVISQLQTEQYGSYLPLVIESDDAVFGRFHVGMAGQFHDDWYGYIEASSLVGLKEVDAQRITLGVQFKLK
ncbi:autotransporter outer membrane beta-barrel domain-containing protein [Photobacterium jeanii]|nr:autotransporter outer membrane beta-barrel domain-containing protein [Photobacterium jeanii]PST89419.1 autotransporter domain-containing protein [Photobacterium jeanii]